ncbi:uncharacterized protein palmdb [Trichomycterus rosablanca]|uniref:uncharacterized protein palmdb n=1 Tax=Trichomycterus rosablanca TaxID=2290929 RepID=UPI002F358E7A
MEEADLLRERLLAITDKRKIQEDIAKKRREIEDVKFKLQYLKKKSLREQWLMDGLSGQNEQDEEAVRAQAQKDQQQTEFLQSQIQRIEGEIEDLETQELNISRNEELILKQLKEVEKTAEDIIKRSASEDLEAVGRKVNEDYFSIQNQTRAELQSLSEPVTMETSEESSTDNIMDQGMDAQVTESFESKDTGAEDSHEGDDNDLLEALSAKLAAAEIHPNEDLPSSKEALVLEDAREELNRNESITSSVSDTPSSAESVYENEAMKQRQDSVKDEILKDVLPVILPEDDEGGDMLDPLKAELHQALLESLDCGEVNESMLESFIREEVMSDMSNESGQNPEDLDECLLVEIAAASSDSETDEKWRNIFSSSINKEDDDSYLDSLQLSAQELFIQKPERNSFEEPSEAKQETEEDVRVEEDVLEQPENTSAYTPPPQEISYNPSTLFHALSKISEDEEELGKGSVNHKDPPSSCVKSDFNKKVPKDFCVIQEMKSENVSTEHVDFQVARNQWLQMEEQTKNLAHQPISKTGTCQGNHSTMYTPVRNIDRNKKDPDLEGLPLKREYQHTQFSPCSEDSGVDDSSYRSPCDDPETPNEKISFAIEQDDRLRRERGMSKSYSSDCVPGKGKPVILNFGSFRQESDEKRKMLEHWDDDCKLSPSTNMPSFIITSSPTKGPLRHELTANNVIILEPESCHQSPRHAGKLMTSKSADWRSEDTPNLIILETSNLIIRSASDFNLNTSVEMEEKAFLNNPFFKLRSRSTISLVDEEIKKAKQREEELKKERAGIYTKENFLASPNLLDSAYDKQDDFPTRCKSSPSSPMKSCRMDRSALSCDHRFPESYSGGRRKSAMALRWEAGEFANN